MRPTADQPFSACRGALGSSLLSRLRSLASLHGGSCRSRRCRPASQSGNGRLEANELFIAAKYPGRVKEILVDEGDTVEAGQIVARMDTEALEAQLRAAEARMQEAQDSERVAVADVSTKQAGVAMSQSEITAKQADYVYARQQYVRSRNLVGRGAVSEQEAQINSAKALSTRAEVSGARAHLAGSRADLEGARALVGRSRSTIAAAAAEADRLRAEIKDSVLVAPIRGRVESRLAEPGEVLGAGGRVFSVVDLSDVYMYVFLPERVTGKLTMGSEARIVLDAAPQYPIRAYRLLRFADGAVHAQDGRDRGGTAQPDVPGEAADPQGPAAAI